MPNFIVSLNQAQAQRAASAFAFLSDDGSDATAAQVGDWLLRQVRGKVRQHEARLAERTSSAQIGNDLRDEGWD